MDPTPLRLRPYQHELLAHALQTNTIAVLATGSGKTYLAIARILHALQTSSSATSLAWFLAPTVALAEQHLTTLTPYLHPYVVNILTSKAGVETWTSPLPWRVFLKGVRVVIATPAVLLDALTHGFVRFEEVDVLVFDEVHRCVGKSPMAGVMRGWYWPAKRMAQGRVPGVLGLTASLSGRVAREVQGNLDARVLVVKKEKGELERWVHTPRVRREVVGCAPGEMAREGCGERLRREVEGYVVREDPWVVEMESLRHEDAKANRKWEEVVVDGKLTFCQQQLKALMLRANALLEQIGPVAVEWYLRQCVQRFRESLAVVQNGLLTDMNEKEKKHLGVLLDRVAGPSLLNDSTSNNDATDLGSGGITTFTDKVQRLVAILLEHASPGTRGIIFAEQRAVVSALAWLLRSISSLTATYSIGTSVGTSSFPNRKTTIADLAELKTQQGDLEDFRSGSRNLMIATSVLEEGIDVSACNLVICFDPPKNLVSFVQRRGRARKANSEYIIFVPEDEVNHDPEKWERMEEEMKAAYMDEQRHQGNMNEQDDGNNDDDEDPADTKTYRVESTGAALRPQDAKAHLYHFCAVSCSHTNHVDLRPEFEIHTLEPSSQRAYTASVLLPAFVHRDYRCTTTTEPHRSKSAAIRAVAFDAYIKLHQAGLVNDHLLPLTKNYGPDEGSVHIDQPSLVQVHERKSSWRMLAKAAVQGREWMEGRVEIRLRNDLIAALRVCMPCSIPALKEFPLYWNEEVVYSVRITLENTALDEESLQFLRLCSRNLLSSVHAARMDALREDFVVLFAPDEKDLEIGGTREAVGLIDSTMSQQDYGLLRVKGEMGRAYFFAGLATSQDEAGGEIVEAIVTTFPKRKDILHRVVVNEEERTIAPAANTAKRQIPLVQCTVDNLPQRYAVAAALVPSVLHRIGIALLTQDLHGSLLRDVGIQDLSLLTEAISAPHAREMDDYNRLEFLGDCVLKFVSVLQVSAQHPTWPEGYLGLEKFRIVSNNNLAKAALKIGLDQFIVDKAFTGLKWRPQYIGDFSEAVDDGEREMSSKVLADVVEALIGAAYVDGGIERAFKMVQLLLPDETWYAQNDAIHSLLPTGQLTISSDLSLLEQLIGHTFTHPALLIEAITHASCPTNEHGLSYERLEFLGDAVLDMLIVPHLFAHPRKLQHWELHNARNALVNAHFLAYCCMTHSVAQETYDVVPSATDPSKHEIHPSSRPIHIHDFLRASMAVIRAKNLSVGNLASVHDSIAAALQRGSTYPWPDLLRLNAMKVLSDLIESLLGAVFLDSNGDLETCRLFLEKLGVIENMRRFLDAEEFITLLPKERLGFLVDSETVRYVVDCCDANETQTQDEEEEGEETTKRFRCQVFIGEESIAVVEKCASRQEAEMRGAAKAVDEVLRCRGGKRRKVRGFEREKRTGWMMDMRYESMVYE